MKNLILPLLIGICLFLPALTFAQTLQPDTFTDPTVNADYTISGGFVPCSGVTCSTCDFVVMANTIIKWLFGMAFIFFAILAVKAGIGLVISGGNPSAKSAAKSSFTNAFIGLFIFLGAWLLIDTLMRSLLAGGNGEITISNFGPWQRVKCGEDQVAPGITEGYFKGDLPYVPGQPMSSYSGPAYSGGPLPQCTNQYCSVSALMAAGFTQSEANVMSCIAITESSGNPSNPPYNTLHPGSNSTACGLFSIVRNTWNGTAAGNCRNFDQCTNAACNTQTALRLVRSSGYQPWTCNGCNSKAEACISQYRNK